MFTDSVYAYSLKGKILYIGRTHDKERRSSEHKSCLNPNNSENSRLFFHSYCIANDISFDDLDCDILSEDLFDTENHPSKEFFFYFHALKDGHDLKNQKYGDSFTTEKLKGLSFSDFNNKKEFDKWLEKESNKVDESPRSKWVARLRRDFAVKSGWKKNKVSGFREYSMTYGECGITITYMRKGSGKNIERCIKVNGQMIESQIGDGADSRAGFLAVKVILEILEK